MSPHQQLANLLFNQTNGCRCLRHYTSSNIHLRNNNDKSTVSSPATSAIDYSKTIYLPKSKFPPIHNPKVELKIQEDDKFAHNYLEQNPKRKPYVIHDGPPFANGQIHIGHAINKILKDIAARYAMITGHKVEFITGWDCHGLPIEMQVLKLLEEQHRQSNYGGSLLLDKDSPTTPEQFRTKARSYAKSQIDLQMASFKRIGLLTDWNKRYTTDDPSYVANQLRAFSLLQQQKLIFKDLMPVNWSPINRTTVADADIEYKPDHVSKSAYILYEIIDPPFAVDFPGQPIYSLIWTTTPWTLLENQAIAFNPQETYCILKAWKDSPEFTKNFLVSIDSSPGIQELLIRIGYKCELKTYVPGNSLKGLKYKPLLKDLIVKDCKQSCDSSSISIELEPLPFLEADFVEGVKGTGLVHISPNYGHEDFSLLRKNKLPIRRGLVTSSGLYSEGAGQELAGKSIFSDGIEQILNLLDLHQALLSTDSTTHSYPYETRTNMPIIVRASQQIFLDTGRIVPRCLKALESSSFFPETRRKHFINTLKTSPNWCISRQRIWGTPIPVLYESNDIDQERMITHPELVEHFCRLLYRKRFMDYWWTSKNEELVPQELLDKCKLPYKSDSLVRGMDIFDVWSDSGLSWQTIANSLDDTKSQADLYLEGHDQIRGWFSASSLLSIALRGCLPSKRFFLHGFALDENNRKMSKSQGNVVNPIELFETFGVDPIRLWAAKSAGDNNDVSVKPKEFKSHISEMIIKIRVTFKYLLGFMENDKSVPDLDIGKLDHTKLSLFDQYYLNKLYIFASTVDGHYRNYRYDLVIHTVNEFLVDHLSPIYFNTIKDSLYCDDLESETRKSCLTVMKIIYNILSKILYPVVPHIIHEVNSYYPTLEPLNEWQDLGHKASWKNEVLNEQYELIIKFRELMVKCLGERIDKLREYDATLVINDKKIHKQLIKLSNNESKIIAELFKTSSFALELNEKLTEQVKYHYNDFDILQGCKQALSDLKTPEEAVKSAAKGKQSRRDECHLIDSIEMEVLNSWSEEIDSNEHVIGGVARLGNNKTPTIFEMKFKKSSKKKCPRCRRYCVSSEIALYCDRCQDILKKLGLV